MKKYVYLISLFLISISIIDASNIGKRYPSEKKSWIDSESGYEITQWTNNSKNWHLYFNVESFIDNNHAIIFSERSGSKNLFILDLESGEMIQITDEENIDGHVWHVPSYNTIYYTLLDNTLKSLNTKTFEAKEINKFDVPIESFTISCDNNWFIFSSGGKKIDGAKTIGPFAIYKYGINSKEYIQVTPGYGFIISHLQANPINPNIVSFCWQHMIDREEGTQGMTPQRIWQVNIDESEVKPIALQETGLHRTHEFWFYDGSKIGYSARYTWGKNKGKQFIGFVIRMVLKI